MTILQRDKVGNTIEPRVLFPHFRFEDYIYDACSFAAYDQFVIVVLPYGGPALRTTASLFVTLKRGR